MEKWKISIYFKIFIILSFVSGYLSIMGIADDKVDVKSSNKKTPSSFSIQMHSLTGDFENHKRTVDLIASLGIKQVRDELFWHIVEKEKGVYKIPEQYLKNIDYSLSKGLDTLIILNYANELYENGNAPTKEESFKAFAQYAYTLAKELKGKVHYFEIWNEPNVDGFWRPKADPLSYANLLKYVYPEIKKGNADATVVGISLAGVGRDFVETVFQAGGYNNMDAVSIHPYCHPKSPESAKIFDELQWHYENFKKYGPQKAIWITEIGWPTNIGGGITEEKQADFIARQYLLALSTPFIETTFYYWFGPDGKDETWSEDRFGIIHQDCSPKPAFHSLKNLINILKDAKFDKKLNIVEELYGQQFRKQKGDFITALWGNEVFLPVSIETKTNFKIILGAGHSEEFAPFEGKIYLTISPSPIYIESSEPLKIAQMKAPIFDIALTDGSNSIARGLSKEAEVHWNDFKSPAGKFQHSSKTPDLFKLNFSAINKDEKEFLIISTSQDSKIGKTQIESFFAISNFKFPSAYSVKEIDVCEPVILDASPLPPQKNERKFLVSINNISGKEIGRELEIFVEPFIKKESESPSFNISQDKIILSESKFNFSILKSNLIQNFPVQINSSIDDDAILIVKIRAKLENGVSIEREKIIDFYTSYKVDSPIKIDGDLSDWQKGLTPIRIQWAKQYTGGYVKWDGPEDSSVRLYTSWDDKWFYIGVEQTDDIYSDPVTGFGVYNNDGVEIYFDTDYENDRWDEKYSSDDHQYGLFPSQGKDIVYSWSQLGGESKNSKIKIERSPTKEKTISGTGFKGMIIEAAIPLEELKIVPKDGKMIGFNCAFTDDDDPRSVHPFFQEIQMTWTGKKNSWQNPRAFGILFFANTKKIKE